MTERNSETDSKVWMKEEGIEQAAMSSAYVNVMDPELARGLFFCAEMAFGTFRINGFGKRKALQAEFVMGREKKMSEQVMKAVGTAPRSKTRVMAQIAMLGAVAGVLMNLEFPLPFLAPAFYQMDFSEIPTLIAAFAMGPAAGILTELVKILVHLVTKGTITAGVGDLANFVFGCTFVVPAGILYRIHGKKSRKHAVLGMAVGTVVTSLAACFMNAFVLLPAYGKAFGMPVSAFVEMGTAVHASVKSLPGFCALIIVPFNLFKYTVTSVIVFFIYKRIRVILRGD